ncbi:MAG: hypothetical protein IPK66_07510 [Rhodospirillales bacterium]|nr:hypothetical protein [Rhodospirillales bacterium]
MEFEAWKTALIEEIETAAEGRAEHVLARPDDPRIEKSQKALFDLAEQLRALPPDYAPLKTLFTEESELSNLMRATVGEPERRYRDAKEGLLAAYGIDHEPFENITQFLKVLRDRVDETISEYRLRA